jgi:hypothetical protein
MEGCVDSRLQTLTPSASPDEQPTDWLKSDLLETLVESRKSVFSQYCLPIGSNRTYWKPKENSGKREAVLFLPTDWLKSDLLETISSEPIATTVFCAYRLAQIGLIGNFLGKPPHALAEDGLPTDWLKSDLLETIARRSDRSRRDY